MDRICFTLATDANNETLVVCAHERNYDGKGTFISRKVSDYQSLPLGAQMDFLNDMIITLINHVDVKDNVKFSDYQRKAN